jgi:uncharacterized repeat protein (TIGR02543 family)
MKIRSLFFLTIIVALLGMITVCKDPNLPDADLPATLPNYTVSFEANGGSPTPQRQTINQGGKVAEPAYMIRAGYGFGGWYKEADCVNIWDFTTDTVNRNITLYAKWDSNYYTVGFDEDGGSPAPEQEKIAHGGKAINPPDMSKTGYTFGG